MDNGSNLPHRANYTWGQIIAFRGLLSEAKRDAIFGTWILQVGMHGVLNGGRSDTSDLGGIDRQMASLGIVDNNVNAIK
jgi:hypothetical protein